MDNYAHPSESLDCGLSYRRSSSSDSSRRASSSSSSSPAASSPSRSPKDRTKEKEKKEEKYTEKDNEKTTEGTSDGQKTVHVSGLTPNVTKEHLVEIFGLVCVGDGSVTFLLCHDCRNLKTRSF